MRTFLSADRPASAWLRPHVAALRPESAGPFPALSASTFGLSDKGNQRSTNEDRFLIASPASALWVAREGRHASELGYADIEGDIFAVADGIGPCAGGCMASALALETMSDSLLAALKWIFALGGPEAVGVEMLEQIKIALHRADQRIREEASRDVKLRGTGTTLTMAYRHGSFLYVGHTGDSRCYVLRDGQLHRITRDHTVVAELLRLGLVTAAGARRHPGRHVLTNALGPSTSGLRVDVHCLWLHAGDTLLLCTDGLSGVASDLEIAVILQDSDSPRDACGQLVQRANELGGPENITAVVARFEAASDPPRPPRARRRSQA
jgi:serine/threonine protein phosphatase PrpC